MTSKEFNNMAVCIHHVGWTIENSPKTYKMFRDQLIELVEKINQVEGGICGSHKKHKIKGEDIHRSA